MSSGDTLDIAVAIVIVTYGDRWPLLKQVLQSVLKMDGRVQKVIVIDNASKEDIKKNTWEEFKSSKVIVHRHAVNCGSAGGYKAGIEYVINQTDCERIWLLDDDNKPANDALAKLIQHYQELVREVPPGRLALVAFRKDREYLRRLAQGVEYRRIFPRRSSFLGFHVANLPYYLMRLFRPARSESVSSYLDAVIEIPYGPFGGLFFHTSVIAEFGYPEERFVVHAADIEYTNRIKRGGGKVFLVPSSIVEDIEISWYLKTKGLGRLAYLLSADSDLGTYYIIRNHVYFNRYFWLQSSILYHINKWVYIGILVVIALIYQRQSRLPLVIQAIREGEQGRLGRREDWPTSYP